MKTIRLGYRRLVALEASWDPDTKTGKLSGVILGLQVSGLATLVIDGYRLRLAVEVGIAEKAPE